MSFGQMTLQDLEDLVGRELGGRYRLDQYLDRGGYGAVYRGFDTRLEQVVAVKVGLSHRESMREARFAAGVQHPHIVRALDCGVDGGLAYLVLEFLHGITLEKLFIDQGNRLSTAQLRQFVEEVGDALAHLHAINLVHRDLKPRNVFLRNSVTGGVAASDESAGIGRFVLLDFGIATKLDSVGTLLNVTQKGAGTPEYMAPETIRSTKDEAASPKSDIYSFGVLLYQLVTGRVPFPRRDTSAQSFAECLQAIVNSETPAFHEVDPERSYPAPLERLVQRCLSKVPSERPDSMFEVVRAFRSAIGEEQPVSLPARKASQASPVVASQVAPVPGDCDPAEAVTLRCPPDPSADTDGPFKRLEELHETDPITSRMVPSASDDLQDHGSQPGYTLRRLGAILAFLLLVVAGGLIYVKTRPSDARDREPLVASASVVKPVTPDIPSPRPAATERPMPDGRPVASEGTGVPMTATSAADVKPPANVKPPADIKSPVVAELPAETFNRVHLEGAEPIEFVRAKGGRFWMGSPPDEAARDEDEQRVEVTLSADFWMATTELSQRQWKAVKEGRVLGLRLPEKEARPADETPDLPRSDVSWFDAVAFCNELSKQCGLPSYYAITKDGDADLVDIPNRKGTGFRLPTSAEWEYACRAGTTTPYSFGDTLKGPAGEKLANVAGEYPLPARSYPPNPWGLYDMHGNVGEWCFDAYQESLPGGVDPVFVTGDVREWRGGSSDGQEELARSASRVATGLATTRNGQIGFRLARNVIEDLSMMELIATRPPQSVRPPPPPLKTTADKADVAMTPPVEPGPLPATVTSKSTEMPLVLIAAGEFWMGSGTDDPRLAFRSGSGLTETDLKDESPRHRVRITKPFYLGKFEVTQEEYRKVTRRNPSAFSSTGRSRTEVAGVKTDQFPVENVSWFDAIGYCNALSEADGLPPYYDLKKAELDTRTNSIKAASVAIRGGKGYRLPTEAEWEYACRAGTTTVYHFGDSLNGDGANVDGTVPFGTRESGKLLKRPTPVNDALYPVNAFGLSQMHGNVREWCQDGYSKEAYHDRGALTEDPVVETSDRRVLRGGSWISAPRHARSAYRYGAEPGEGSNRIGFRVARTP